VKKRSPLLLKVLALQPSLQVDQVKALVLGPSLKWIRLLGIGHSNSPKGSPLNLLASFNFSLPFYTATVMMAGRRQRRCRRTPQL
jgi:hypothetical protein